MRKVVDKNELFAKAPVNKAILTMTIPTIISQLINLIYNIVDTIYIGRVGNPFMVGGLTVSMTIYLLCIAFANLFGMGGGSLIARLLGKKEDEKVKNVASYSLFFAFLASILYSLVIGLFLNKILIALGASNDTLIYARQYVLFVVVIGNVPNILSMTLAHLLRNIGKSSESSFGLSLGGILNIVLDPIFMYLVVPKGDEVKGAAMATLISTTVAFIFLLILYIDASKHSPLGFSFKALKEIKREEIKEIYAIGVPSAILTAMIDVGNGVLNKLMTGHGDLQEAAIGIVMKAERLPNAINLGLCQGMLPIVAYNYASKNEERRKLVVNRVRLLGLINGVLAIIFYQLLTEPICKLFLATNTGDLENSAKTIEFAKNFLRIRCFLSPFQFINFHSSFCMQAMGDGKGTLIHAIIRILGIYIPLMLLLNMIFGLYGLVSAFVFSELLSGIVALLLLRSYQNKKILKTS